MFKKKIITYTCSECNRKSNSQFPIKCEFCNSLLNVDYGIKKYSFYDSDIDIFRYYDFLPLNSTPILNGGNKTTTPLIKSENIAREMNIVNLYLKDETKSITKSCKDRMAIVALNLMAEKNIKDFAVTSTGNSISAFAYWLSKVKTMRMHCFISDKFKGRYRFLDQERIVIHKYKNLSLYEMKKKAVDYLENHSAIIWEGGFFNQARRAGLSMAFIEAVEQMKKTPDYYFQATSSAMGVLGVYETACRLLKSGIISKIPALICVQQASCSPMVNAFLENSRIILKKHIVDKPIGIAKAILRGNPTNTYPYIYDIVKKTGGNIISVSEIEIINAEKTLNKSEGINATVDGAVALAGLLKMKNNNIIQANSNILVNITG